ncbi:MAG: hypothetical protein R3C27_11765 [Hyphomonadaceae bacterium]
MRALVLAVVLGGCASSAAVEPADPVVVVAVERAFAARGAEIGWVPAFREFTAPDGQLSQAEIVSAPETLAATPDDGSRALFWWPAYAGIARSGDLGFTTGPFSVDEARTPRGQYFTVWRRQADGSWKWIWDGGPGRVSDPLNVGIDAPTVPSMPVADLGVGSAEEAARQVRALESGHATAGSLVSYLAADAMSFRPGRPRGEGPAAEGNLVFPNAEIAYRLARVEASSAGDLVFTLGQASWETDGQAREGFFARIWQFRADGWRIVYDQLTIRPPPQPPASG